MTVAEDKTEEDSLRLLRSNLDQDEAACFWAEFESQVPHLFMRNGEKCKTAIVRLLRPEEVGERDVIKGSAEGPLGSVMKWASTAKELEMVLTEQLPLESNQILLLSRLNSWSRLNATVDMFYAIHRLNNVMPQFLKIVMSFRAKLASQDEDFMACYTRVEVPRQDKQQKELRNLCENDTGSYDICYNIRHFERHGRTNLEDPWSCRQSAVHHKYYAGSGTSSSVIIQAPVIFSSFLNQCQPTDAPHPLSLHIQFMGAGMGKWREYLDYIATELKACDDKIAIHKPYADFKIDFSSKQRLHNLRKKLHHAESILSNTADTLQSIGKHAVIVGDVTSLPATMKDSFQRAIENLSSELNNYMHTTKKLLKRSADIHFMYNDVLKLHAQEIQCHNGEAFTQISKAQAREARAMADLAGKSFQDARTMRIATIIAMIYLPANLVLSFFSSTLVWFEDNAILRLHSETWIAIVTTLVLASGTTYASVWWNRRERQRDSKSQYSES